MKFLYAKTFKENYIITAKFYKYKSISCRSLLRITDKENPNGIEIIVVMLNPGSSVPLDKNYKEKSIRVLNLKNMQELKLIATKPDNAQYQIIRLMKEMNISRASVINLFDIRDSKSADLIRNVKNTSYPKEASIFSEARVQELKKMINKNSHVIVGWGNIKCIQEYGEKALEILSELTSNVYYVKDENGNISHPSPFKKDHKLRWLVGIILKLIELKFNKK